MGQPVLPRRSSEEKNEKITKESTAVTCTGEKTSKPGSEHSQEVIVNLHIYILFHIQIIGIFRELLKR